LDEKWTFTIATFAVSCAVNQVNNPVANFQLERNTQRLFNRARDIAPPNLMQTQLVVVLIQLPTELSSSGSQRLISRHSNLQEGIYRLGGRAGIKPGQKNHR
jgi:hypothetical protein